jgi:hypothetical protein
MKFSTRKNETEMDLIEVKKEKLLVSFSKKVKFN